MCRLPQCNPAPNLLSIWTAAWCYRINYIPVLLSEPKSGTDRNTIKRVDSDGYVVSGIQVMTTYTSSALSIPLFIFLPMWHPPMKNSARHHLFITFRKRHLLLSLHGRPPRQSFVSLLAITLPLTGGHL